MKKSFIKSAVMFLILAGAGACSDDDVSPVDNDALLTRISRNGLTQLELLYDLDRRIYRIDYFLTGTLSHYILLEYDDEGITEFRHYQANNHSLNFKSVLTLDNMGRIIKKENYSQADLDNVLEIQEYDYNTGGQVVSKTNRFPGELLHSREEYTYDERGNLSTLQRTIDPGQPGEYVSFLAEYTYRGPSMPEHWKDYMNLLHVSGYDYLIREMFDEEMVLRSWNSDEELTHESSTKTSDHEFDANGNLARQVRTQEFMVPSINEVMTEVSYEYSQ